MSPVYLGMPAEGLRFGRIICTAHSGKYASWRLISPSRMIKQDIQFPHLWPAKICNHGLCLDSVVKSNIASRNSISQCIHGSGCDIIKTAERNLQLTFFDARRR